MVVAACSSTMQIQGRRRARRGGREEFVRIRSTCALSSTPTRSMHVRGELGAGIQGAKTTHSWALAHSCCQPQAAGPGQAHRAGAAWRRRAQPRVGVGRGQLRGAAAADTASRGREQLGLGRRADPVNLGGAAGGSMLASWRQLLSEAAVRLWAAAGRQTAGIGQCGMVAHAGSRTPGALRAQAPPQPPLQSGPPAHNNITRVATRNRGCCAPIVCHPGGSPPNQPLCARAGEVRGASEEHLQSNKARVGRRAGRSRPQQTTQKKCSQCEPQRTLMLLLAAAAGDPASCVVFGSSWPSNASKLRRGQWTAARGGA